MFNIWRITLVACGALLAGCLATSGVLVEDEPTDPSLELESYWNTVHLTARDFAEVNGDTGALAALDLLDDLDRWAIPDPETRSFRVPIDAPDWIQPTLDELMFGLRSHRTSDQLGALLPGLAYLGAIERGASTPGEVSAQVQQRSGWITCAPLLSCGSKFYNKAKKARKHLRSKGYHRVPDYAGGSQWDFAKPTSLCRRYERVICQTNCTAVGCNNPPAGKYRIYKEGPEPDPEVFSCPASSTFYGFASWSAYVWAYHAFC